MKHSILLLIVFFSVHCYSIGPEDFPLSVKTVADFAVRGWSIGVAASGDLNSDGLEDYAFEMIQDTKVEFIDTLANVEQDSYEEHEPVYYNPRVLLIAFQRENGFDTIRTSEQVLPNHTNSLLYEELSLEITRGVLNIITSSQMTSGSWWASSTTQRFRYQNNDFYLIGKDELSCHRAGGDAEEYSTNYLTKKQRIKSFNMFSESVPEKITWKTIVQDSLKRLE